MMPDGKAEGPPPNKVLNASAFNIECALVLTCPARYLQNNVDLLQGM